MITQANFRQQKVCGTIISKATEIQWHYLRDIYIFQGVILFRESGRRFSKMSAADLAAGAESRSVTPFYDKASTVMASCAKYFTSISWS